MDPRDPEKLFAAALAFHRSGKLVEAEAAYRSLLASHPRHSSALTNLGTLYVQKGDRPEGIRLLGQSLTLNPDQPDASFNLGTLLGEQRHYDQALTFLDRAIALRPGYAKAHANRGNIFRELGHPVEALASLDRALALAPGDARTHHNRGTVLRDLKRPEEALESFERARALQPDLEFLAGTVLRARMELCDWSGIEAEFSAVLKGIEAGNPVIEPFCMLAVPSNPAQQRRCAEIYAARKLPPASARPPRRSPAHRRIRLGYFSGDFRNHPGAHLIAGLIEQHDRSEFEVYGFSYGPDTGDPMRRRLERAFDHFLDVRSRPDEEIVALAREHDIDIAIDRNGYTQHTRTSVFCRGLAPLQVAYLGYPGTLGTSAIDYLIADPVVIPAGHFPHYSEKIVWLPHCYQPNDSTRAISERSFTRAELGLPEGGFVFCCFNNNYKITPDVFDLWMRLLQRVEGSVLWLLEGNVITTRNLRAEATRRGVSPDRIVFARWLEVSDHLARHRVADLFVDTLYYGAHTTASDALWAGLPVVTCRGESFPSRVAASLLTAIGLPELITHSPADYEALAVELAINPEKLQALKRKLAAHRSTYPLFDTDRYARDIEQAYLQMWQRYEDGLAPEPIRIAGQTPGQ